MTAKACVSNMLNGDAVTAWLSRPKRQPEDDRTKWTKGSLKAATLAFMRDCYDFHGGNVADTAASLGVTRSTVMRKLELTKKCRA